MTLMATPWHKNPFPGGHEIYNFARPLPGYHIYSFSLSDLCLGIVEKIFKEKKPFSLYDLYGHTIAQ